MVVQRERNAFAEARQINEGDKKIVQGEVSVPYQSEQLGDRKWRLTLDLDSVYAAVENDTMKEVYSHFLYRLSQRSISFFLFISFILI